jgi:hypothetical protein
MVCIFCGRSGKMTKEHVVARWGRDAVATRVGRGTRIKLVFTDSGRNVRADTGLSIILRGAVCEACNSGWLAGWEDKAGPWLAPAILGEPIAIARGPMQELVAAWAVKTALLAV